MTYVINQVLEFLYTLWVGHGGDSLAFILAPIVLVTPGLGPAIGGTLAAGAGAVFGFFTGSGKFSTEVSPEMKQFMLDNNYTWYDPNTGQGGTEAQKPDYIKQYEQQGADTANPSQESWDNYFAEQSGTPSEGANVNIPGAETGPTWTAEGTAPGSVTAPPPATIPATPPPPTPPPIAPAMPAVPPTTLLDVPPTAPAQPTASTDITTPPTINPEPGVGDPFPEDILGPSGGTTVKDRLGRIVKSRGLWELGGGLVGGVVASKTSKPSAEAEQALDAILNPGNGKADETADILMSYFPELMDEYKMGNERSRAELDRASGRLTSGEQALDSVAKYGKGLFGGGPSAMEAIAPEVNAVKAQSDQFRNQLAQLAPRGGGRAMTLLQLPGQEQQQITSLLSKARQHGAGLLTDVASGYSQLGAVGNAIAQSEHEIAYHAGQLGMTAAELTTRIWDIMQRGAQSVLDYDIKNRFLNMDAVQRASKGGMDFGGLVRDIIFDTDNSGGTGLWGSRNQYPTSGGARTPDYNPYITGKKTSSRGRGSSLMGSRTGLMGGAM
jgi:hypothetical protein